MDLKKYVQDAIATESKVDHINTEYHKLLGVMKIFVAAGNMLDAIKKNIFYGKEINVDSWLDNISNIDQEVMFLELYKATDPSHQFKIDPRLFHALIGIATESTELIEAIIKAIDNDIDIDHVNVKEEMGDVFWYSAIAIDSTGADWEKILETNISKLKKRYPEKFTTEAAINRDLQAERKILEGEQNDGEIS